MGWLDDYKTTPCHRVIYCCDPPSVLIFPGNKGPSQKFNVVSKRKFIAKGGGGI